MDVIDLRVIITVSSFIAFLGIVFWAYSGRQKQRFDEAANLPFADEAMQQRTLAAGSAEIPGPAAKSASQPTTDAASEVFRG